MGFRIADRAANHVVRLAAHGAAHASQLGKDAASQASARNEESDAAKRRPWTTKDPKTVMKGVVNRLDRLAKQSQQASETKEGDGYRPLYLRHAASRAASKSRSAAQKVSAWNEKHKITEQAAAAAAQGASHTAARLSELDQKYQIKRNVKHFVATGAERIADAVAPPTSQGSLIEIDDTVARPQNGVWCCC